jgi:enoyl-CoA hydratase
LVSLRAKNSCILFLGYPPARVWGCPTTAMWVYRIGLENAKRMLLTGETIGAKEAARIGLISEALPANKLDDHVNTFVKSKKFLY